MTDELWNPDMLPVVVIVGATSKWRADGPNTIFVHGRELDSETHSDSSWGLGGALSLKFARAGYFVVLTSRAVANAASLVAAVRADGGQCTAVALDVSDSASVKETFADIRLRAGDPEVLIYNAGYMAGRTLPPEQELMEFFPEELFEVALDVACRGPFLVAQQVLPSMRTRGKGTILFSNNQYSLRGRKRHTGESLYYPRVMMRALAQALTAEYSEHGVHVANVVVDGFIDSPGTRALPRFAENPELLIQPASIADAFFYLHCQHPSAWSHELQLTASTTKVNH